MSAVSRFESVPQSPGKFVYRIRQTPFSSARFGRCEVCETHVSEACLQVEGVTYESDGEIRVTYADCQSLFGHRECLIGARR